MDQDDGPPPIPDFEFQEIADPAEPPEPDAPDAPPDDPPDEDEESPHAHLETEAAEEPENLAADQWLPKNQLHLLAGPTHGGKSTLAAQLVAALVRGTEWFGLQPPYFAGEIAVFVTDRSWTDSGHWYRRLGLRIPYWSILDHESTSLRELFAGTTKTVTHSAWQDYLQTVVEEKLKLGPDSLLLIDVVNPLMGGEINSYDRVFAALGDLNRYLQRRKVTCIGVGHAGKVKGNQADRYARAIDRIAGSAAMLGAAGTAMHVAVEEETGVEGIQALTVVPRRLASRTIHLMRDGRGLFRACPNAAVAEARQRSPGGGLERVSVFKGVERRLFDAVQEALREDDGARVLRAKEVREIAFQAGLKSPTTVHLALKTLVANGQVRRVRRGHYRFLAQNLQSPQATQPVRLPSPPSEIPDEPESSIPVDDGD